VSQPTQKPDIVAELLLDERQSEVSGRRLIDWAKLCEASGVLLPRRIADALRTSLRDYAESLHLRAYPEPSPAPQPSPSGPAAGARTAFSAALSAALSAGDMVTVGLTLNRTLGGPRHRGGLYPDEFAELASIVRQAAARTAGLKPPASPRPHATEIAVVIRTKNEAAWLPKTLPALLNQTLRPKEIVIVDNDSTDETRAIAGQFNVPVITISDKEFTFGKALNWGIAKTATPWFVSLSAHCVPVNDRWLGAFASHCADPFVAGVYGRQEPMADSTDFDKRDLWTTFGVEPRLQRGQDYFFHNANALIRRTAWDRTPFDESLNGVEDRDWAKKVLAEGYVIHYEPGASVYHKHGIHQGRNEARAKRVVKVIEMIQRQPVGSSG